MKTSALISACLLCCSMAANGAVTIEEKVFGPANQGIYVVSPSGAQAVHIGMKVTQLVVSRDGVEGPAFDELYNPHGASFMLPQQTGSYKATSGGVQSQGWPVIYSDAGEHFAYVGRQAAEYVVMYDNKEIYRGDLAALTLQYGALTISPKGKHVHWVEMNKERTNWRTIVGGKPGPWSGNQTMSLVFDALAEKHYAYNAGEVGNYQSQMLVVDGQKADYQGIKPVFTADGSLLFTVSIPSIQEPETRLMANGKTVTTGTGVKAVIPGPVGSRYAAIVSKRVSSSQVVETLILDGKEVAGAEGASKIWFSDDGAHYAVLCNNQAARSMFIFADGKRHKEYSGAGGTGVQWTPDGSRIMYTAIAAGRSFLVVNETEVAADGLVSLKTAPAGNRYGYSTRDGMNRNFSVMIDGTSVLPTGFYPVDLTLAFSPDGTRYGLLVGPVGRNEVTGTLIDGVLQTDIKPGYFQGPPGVTNPSGRSALLFSADNQHVASFSTTTQAAAGMHVNGIQVRNTGQAPFSPWFTPDSRHLLWIEPQRPQTRDQPETQVVYVDGVESLRVAGRLFGFVNFWTVEDNGTLHMLGSDGDIAKRYTLRVSGDDTNIVSMIKAEEDRKEQIAQAALAEQQQAADAAAAAAQKKADDAAAAKAAQEKRVADALLARQKAIEAKTAARQAQIAAQNLKRLNAQRAAQGLPPLDALPQ